MNDKIKLIIEIPKEHYRDVIGCNKPSELSTDIISGFYYGTIRGEIFDDVLFVIKKEIKEKCDRIDDIARANIYQYAPHREIQDLLSEILTSIDNAESIDPNDVTRMFEGVTEWPKDAFKGWTTEELLEQIRAEREEKENGKNE